MTAFRAEPRVHSALRARSLAVISIFAIFATLLQVSPVSAQSAPESHRTQVAEPPVAEEEIGDDTVRDLAADPAGSPRGTRLDVEVHGPSLQRVRSAVAAVGGEVYGQVPGFFIEARVPVEQLVNLNDSPSVTRVSSVTRASTIKPKSFAANEALVSSVQENLLLDAWHDVGHTGAGQKIGILDIFGTAQLEFAISQGRVPTPAGAFCLDSGNSCSITLRNGGSHGVAVAEVVHSAAPDAELYLATVTTLSDLSAAIEWFAAQGVTVINRSETSEFDGPGDGTGPTASLVDRAVALDMIWVAAGGNAGGDNLRLGENWVGEFNDPDGNGFHNWENGSEHMEFTCGFLLGMRWDDWDDTTIATDYDIWIFDERRDRIPESTGQDVQSEPAHRPLEQVETVCSGPTDRDYLAIRRFGDPDPDGPDQIQILGNQTAMEEWVNARSATGPGADSASPGAITVGATQNPAALEVAGYSSHGPTTDGRDGVDLIAASCVPVPDFFNFCFSGTSASAPLVSGVMAVLRSAQVIETASEAESVLASITQDQGPEGPDPQYGHGTLRMPPPAFFGVRTFLPSCSDVPATLVGTPGDDVLIGTDGPDVIVAGLGNDIIRGLGGDDLICGGFGDDTIDGGPGDDTLLGGPGADVVRGRDGSDFVLGGHGHDDLEGNAGDDEVRGFTGRDYVKGGLGDDIVAGGAGNDRIVGGDGFDELFGGEGVDRCREIAETAEQGQVFVSCRP